MASTHRCPACGAPRNDGRTAIAPYEEAHDYYWAGIRVPDWLAAILDVPWRQQLDLLLIGFVIGLIVAGLAVVWGLMFAGYWPGLDAGR